MSATKFIQAYARKLLTKNQGSGITTIPGAMQSEAKAGEIVAMLQQAGIPMNQLDDFIRSEADVAKFLNIIESASKPRVYSGQAAIDQLNKIFPKKGEVVQFPQKTSFKEQVEAMKKSGDIVDPNNLKKNDNVLKREMFQNSNLNKVDTVTDTITYIKTLEPVKAMKEANSIIARKGKYKDLTPEQSKKILQDTEDHIFQRDPDNLYDYDPEDMAKGGRAGFYTGGITDVEPSLDDIGHGADALNARTRLMSPGNQATTSTGLNYLLAEDNDNMRIPFRFGGMGPGEVLQDEKKLNQMMENFLIKEAPYGILTPRPKDLELKNLKTADRPPKPEIKIGPYDPQSGINPYSKDNVVEFDDGTFMYKDNGKYFKIDEEDEPYEVSGPGKGAKIKPIEMEAAEGGRIGFAGGGDPKRRAFLKLLATLTGGAAAFKSGLLSLGEGGTKKAVTETVKQATGSGGQVPPYFFKLVNKIKTLGDDVTQTQSLADRQIVKRYKDFELTEDIATGRQEIQRMKTVDDVDAPSYYGNPLTEETYMSYKPGETIIGKGGKPVKTQPEYEEGTAYLRTDREYAGEVVDEMSGISDDIFKEVGEEVPEAIRKTKADAKADGGRIGLFLGGPLVKKQLTSGKGLAREMLKFMTKGSSNAKSPAEILKMMNPKQFEKLLDNPAMLGKISPQTGQSANEMIIEMIKKTKDDRSSMVGDLIGSARKIKKVNESVIAYKNKIIKDMIDGGIDEQTARSFAEKMAKEMKEAAAPQLTSSPPKVTEQGLLELENIQKNLLTKDRQLQATGGLATMLGE